jgi:hypothetical protein
MDCVDRSRVRGGNSLQIKAQPVLQKDIKLAPLCQGLEALASPYRVDLAAIIAFAPLQGDASHATRSQIEL